MRSLVVDAWMIAALWRHFGKAILKARQRAKSVNVPNAHSWMGTANTLEYVVSGTGGQLLKLGANLLGADKGPVKVGTDAFDRMMLQCNIERVLPAYRLAGLGEEAFQNLCLSKIALVEAGLGALGGSSEINWDRPLRLRHTKQVGEFDVACLFSDGVEAEIWAGIDMAEDLPSSCTFYFGGAVNRMSLPAVIIDPRRQPKSNQTEDDAGRARVEEEEVQLRERIRIGAVEWPAPSSKQTLVTIPTTMPASTTRPATPPAQSMVAVVTKGGSIVVSPGSPGLQALAAVAAQVERQAGSLPLPPIGEIFRRDLGV